MLQWKSNEWITQTEFRVIPSFSAETSNVCIHKHPINQLTRFTY